MKGIYLHNSENTIYTTEHLYYSPLVSYYEDMDGLSEDTNVHLTKQCPVRAQILLA